MRGTPDLDADVNTGLMMLQSRPMATAEVMSSEDLLFMLYTSGSTGKPKGLAHSTAGYLLYSALTHKHVFEHQDGDIMGCVGDVGMGTARALGGSP
jgi:acetyl-CoA synthetase